MEVDVHHSNKSKNVKDSFAPRRRGKQGIQSNRLTSHQQKVLSGSTSFEVNSSDFPELGNDTSRCPTETRARSYPSHPHTAHRGFSASNSKTQSHEVTVSLLDLEGLHPALQAKATTMQVEAGHHQKLTSWANVASLPPKKTPISNSAMSNVSTKATDQTTKQTEAILKKKKRRKKKSPQSTSEDADTDKIEALTLKEPPKFEDEEEFPGLVLSPVCLRHVQKDLKKTHQNVVAEYGGLPFSQQDIPAQQSELNTRPSVLVKQKGQGQPRAEKPSSGRKSKVPVQLDLGNMLAALELKQQSQKGKADHKPVKLSVGGALPVTQREASHQKKPVWGQDKIAHNPLDSTSPLVKKGKQREVPKAKKPTPLKRVILKEREERKQKRLLEEQGLLPPTEEQGLLPPTEEQGLLPPTEEQSISPSTDKQGISPATEEQGLSLSTEELQSTSLDVEENSSNSEQTDSLGGINSLVSDSTEGHATTPPVANIIPNHPKIHSRKFRDYCNQVLSKDLDECASALLKELCRFQDRLYQKDPRKARMKRRLVMGLREVLKNLKLHKVKCVIISPNCERVQSKGGLDEVLYTIINTCREQDIPFVFALSRKALGRSVNKAVPVSLVGIFNYEGAQDLYNKMIELSSEARKAYDDMVASLQENSQDQQEHDQDQEADISAPVSFESLPAPLCTEEPAYISVWRKMLEKGYNGQMEGMMRISTDEDLDPVADSTAA
ncbi:hypothetical protein ACEWY4_012612 [Coilia grayii]|uniref:Ribosomal protein eL8/eL30/eS12/Gadd45 domain-containing protein n=1 Tax=Coilia grayii TaxID=363190 RepID=A0ABD1K100_9TELE